MKLSHWILDHNGEVQEEPDVIKWARWFEENDRHVAQDIREGIQISTVFWGWTTTGVQAEHSCGKP